MNQQDIVWVQLPFSDRRRSKFRPALIVSQDAYNRRHDDIIVCAITSNLRPSPYKVPLAQADLHEGHLPRPSMVRADKVLQVEKQLVERSFARLNDTTYDKVVRQIIALVERPTA